MGKILNFHVSINVKAEIIILPRKVESNKTMVLIPKVKLPFDLSSKATHFGLPQTYQNIFFSENTELFELKFHMEYSFEKAYIDKTFFLRSHPYSVYGKQFMYMCL